MKYLDENSDVVSYEYESFRIPYYDSDDHKRHYIPDFLISFSDGRSELWELKPKNFLETIACQSKAVAARVWCDDNDVSYYRLLTKDDLIEMKIL